MSIKKVLRSVLSGTLALIMALGLMGNIVPVPQASAEKNEAEIQQAINMIKGTAVVGVPKSRDSYRIIPVPENVRYCAVNLRNTPKKYIWEMKVTDKPCNPSFFSFCLLLKSIQLHKLCFKTCFCFLNIFSALLIFKQHLSVVSVYSLYIITLIQKIRKTFRRKQKT